MDIESSAQFRKSTELSDVDFSKRAVRLLIGVFHWFKPGVSIEIEIWPAIIFTYFMVHSGIVMFCAGTSSCATYIAYERANVE